MRKINPFTPGSPVGPAMFVGRIDELETLETVLLQTRAAYPTHFMVTGERGIGKTSIFSYLKYIAKGDIPVESETFNFLVIDIDIHPTTTQLGLIERIGVALKRELGKSEKTKKFISNAWDFINRIEVCQSSIKNKSEVSEELLLDEFSYSLADITNRLVSDKSNFNIFETQYDGVIILIDEVDNSSPNLHIGTFLKILSEKLIKLDCKKLAIGIAGLPILKQVLTKSHQSSIRIFDDILIDRLSNNDIKRVISICIKKANQLNNEKTTITDEATNVLINLAEGYPHFIQQFGYSAFIANTTNEITKEDVLDGAFKNNGALEKIGDGYYRDNFYNKIQKDSYREVLRIMAVRLDKWTTRKYIKENFKGSETTLNNAIRALRERNIINTKEGSRGVYRLQHKGFAFWIRLCTSTDDITE